jgi:hypothetical protein
MNEWDNSAEKCKELYEHLLFLRDQVRLGPQIELYKKAVMDLIDSQSSHPHPHPHSDQTPA